MNKVILIGNLTRDPELKTLESGGAVCNMRMAVNEQWKDRDGNAKERTIFLDLTAWGRQAETCAEYLRKGAPIAVDGRLNLEMWEQDGENRSKLSVTAHSVQFLSGARTGDGDGSGRDTKPLTQESAEGDLPAIPDAGDEGLPF
tara:strand:- start:72 stop:503 length:432 start_codon:yes stop_codon:yes gene_type:complete